MTDVFPLDTISLPPTETLSASGAAGSSLSASLPNNLNTVVGGGDAVKTGVLIGGGVIAGGGAVGGVAAGVVGSSVGAGKKKNHNIRLVLLYLT